MKTSFLSLNVVHGQPHDPHEEVTEERYGPSVYRLHGWRNYFLRTYPMKDGLHRSECQTSVISLSGSVSDKEGNTDWNFN